MWHDPMDELIADLEQIAPPEQGKYGGGQQALTAVQHWAQVILRSATTDPDDPELKQAAEYGRRAMNRLVGRPEDWTPPQEPCSCRRCAPETRADPADTADRHTALSSPLPLS